MQGCPSTRSAPSAPPHHNTRSRTRPSLERKRAHTLGRRAPAILLQPTFTLYQTAQRPDLDAPPSALLGTASNAHGRPQTTRLSPAALYAEPHRITLNTRAGVFYQRLHAAGELYVAADAAFAPRALHHQRNRPPHSLTDRRLLRHPMRTCRGVASTGRRRL